MKVIFQGVKYQIDAMVESESTQGAYYHVTYGDCVWNCTCPDHSYRGRACKHIQSVCAEFCENVQEALNE